MKIQELVKDWYAKWNSGDFFNLPLAEGFKHTSPFGTVDGKKAYLDLVQENKDKFLGYKFIIHDALYEGNRGCVRYTAKQGEDFSLDVSEWIYTENELIKEIVAYYHIGEIREERKYNSQ